MPKLFGAVLVELEGVIGGSGSIGWSNLFNLRL